MSKKALVFYGGWEGHDPENVAKLFKEILQKENFDVTLSDSMDSISCADSLKALDLIVPCWTMGDFPEASVNAISEAVSSGVGLAGAHGGMCDSMRSSLVWKFMTGGAFVAHPGGNAVEYDVNILPLPTPLTEGIKDFKVKTEQYYMHIDPAISVLATTRFPTVEGLHDTNGSVDMPLAWTKHWGAGRVYYNSLGHTRETFEETPELIELMRRGFLWAAKASL